MGQEISSVSSVGQSDSSTKADAAAPAQNTPAQNDSSDKSSHTDATDKTSLSQDGQKAAAGQNPDAASPHDSSVNDLHSELKKMQGDVKQSQDSVGKFNKDLNNATSSSNNTKDQIDSLEKDIDAAKKAGASDQKIQDMQGKLDKLKEDQKAEDAKAADLASRFNQLKDSGKLTPDQIKDMQGKLDALKGVNGANKDKLNELQHDLDELKLDALKKQVDELKNKKPAEEHNSSPHASSPHPCSPHPPQPPKDWNQILTQDALAVIQERMKGGVGSAPGPGGLQGANAAVQNMLAGQSASVQKLASDFLQAMQNAAKLNDQTQQVVNLAFQIAGVSPQALLQAAQQGQGGGSNLSGDAGPRFVNSSSGVVQTNTPATSRPQANQGGGSNTSATSGPQAGNQWKGISSAEATLMQDISNLSSGQYGYQAAMVVLMEDYNKYKGQISGNLDREVTAVFKRGY